MGKVVPDGTIDQLLDHVKQNATFISICNAEPTTQTEASATFALARTTVSSTNFTIANGDTSGRKYTTDAFSNLTVDTGGTANHIAIASAATLLAVTTCTAKTLTTTDTVTIPAFDHEVLDPS